MSSETQTSERRESVRKAGRPRLLTLEMVLDAANEMGIENVSMKKLASDLGVGIATIYRYVTDRDELVRLALARRSSHPFIVTPKMDWRDVIKGYAQSLFSVISQDSFALNTYMRGGYGVTAELEFIDSFIEAMVERGFDAAQAGRICRSVGHQVGGAAMGHIHHVALIESGTNRQKLFGETIASYDADDLTHVKAAADGLFDEAYLADWRAGIELLIDGLAARQQLAG
jgi:AcrR family transcriptional regulator